MWTVEDRPLRRRLDDRDGDSVQVAPLHARDQTRSGASSCAASIRRKNEWAYLTPVPQHHGRPAGAQPDLGRRHAGRPRAAAGRHEPRAQAVRDRPASTTDRLAHAAASSNDLTGDVGGDVKYGVTANLTADFTYNTDFAQVEVDEQQVNLTRFSLFFPEKRDFFLEGHGIFDFARGGADAAAAVPSARRPADTPYLFYSRRIGLNAAASIPIDAGGRLTGKVGKFSIGVLNIQTGDEDGVATPSRPTSPCSASSATSCGAAASARCSRTARRVVDRAAGSNQAYGVDAAFSFYQNVGLGAYYARTETPGASGDDDSYQGGLDYGGRSLRRPRRVS